MDAATLLKIEELNKEIERLKGEPRPALKIDFGCGINKKEGFYGVDVKSFKGVDLVLDVGTEMWPWSAETVDEAHASHFIEHLTWDQRIHFFNELGRVLKKGAKATLIWPHQFSDRYWGDPTHKQPLSPFAVYYLNAEWRKTNAPHVDYAQASYGYTCDFDNVISYSLAPWLAGKSPEYVQAALSMYKEAAQDIQVVLIKK